MHDVETAMLHYLEISTKIYVTLISSTNKWFWNGRISSRKKVDTQSKFGIGPLQRPLLQRVLHYPSVPMKVSTNFIYSRKSNKKLYSLS